MNILRGPNEYAWKSSRLVLTILLGLTLLAVGCTSSSETSAAGSTSAPMDRTTEPANNSAVSSIQETDSGYNVEIDPADFATTIDNPYFPLEPGAEWILKGETDEGKEVDTVRVLDKTREVMGVTATVVLDIVTINGELAEKTWDWYAQDKEGNVWYFGENTADYKNGKKVSTAGAWEAGVDGALPGIIMAAEPKVTDSYRQEYYKGQALDMFWVVRTGVTKTTPYGTLDNAVHTLEWSPLEPDVIVEKYHARGVGLIAEKALAGGKEIFELVRFSRP
jgi:hypothetical protein